MFPFFRRKKKKVLSALVKNNGNGGLMTPIGLENAPGSVPAIIHKVKQPNAIVHAVEIVQAVKPEKRLFFVNPPTRDRGYYNNIDLPAPEGDEQRFLPVETPECNFILYGNGELKPGTEVIARKFVTAEGAIDQTVMQVITYKRKKDNERPDMPESHDEIEVLDIGYMFTEDLAKEESFKVLAENDQLFTHIPNINDIEQSWMGNCFLLASLNSILAVDEQVDATGEPIDPTTSGARFIENMMVRKGDDVIVRLYDPRTLEPHYITVKAALHQKDGEVANSHRANWVPIIETAYAIFAMTTGDKAKPGLNLDKEKIVVTAPSFLSVFGSGGQIHNAMTILTGMNATRFNISTDISKLNPFNGDDINFITSKLASASSSLFDDINYTRLSKLANDDIAAKNFVNFQSIQNEFQAEIIKNETSVNWIEENVRKTLLYKIAGKDKALLREWGIYFLTLQFYYPSEFEEMKTIFRVDIKSRRDLENILTNLIIGANTVPPQFPMLPLSLQEKFCDYCNQTYKPEEILSKYIRTKIPASLVMLKNLAKDDEQNKNFKNFAKILKTIEYEVNQSDWQAGKIRLFGVFECLNNNIELVKKWGIYFYTLETYYPQTSAKLVALLEKVPSSSQDADQLISELVKVIPSIPNEVLTAIKESRHPDSYVRNQISQFAGPVGSGEYTAEDFQMFDTFANSLRSGSILSAGTLAKFKEAVPGLRPSHAYTITKVQKKYVNGKELLLVTLRNPWNSVSRRCDFSKNPVTFSEDKNLSESTLDLTDFKTYFSHYSIGMLPTPVKLEEEIIAANNHDAEAVSKSISFGLLSENGKADWLIKFFIANKQMRDSHLMHQMNLDQKNLWEIVRYMSLNIATSKIELTADKANEKVQVIDNKLAAYTYVLNFSLKVLSRQDFRRHDIEANSYFHKGYKNYLTQPEQHKFIAKLLIQRTNIQYLLKDQGIDDLYRLIKDLKTLIATQKAELKKSKNKQYRAHLEQCIQSESQLLRILKMTFKHRMEVSSSYEIMRLSANDYLESQHSLKKSFVRTVKSIFVHNDEDKVLKMYARHLKNKTNKPANMNKEKQLELANRYCSADIAHAKEFLAKHFIATEIENGKIVGENLKDTEPLKELLMKPSEQPDKLRWQLLVPENLQNGKLDMVNVIDGSYVITIEKDGARHIITLQNTLEIADQIAQALANMITEPTVQKADDTYTLHVKIDGLGSIDIPMSDQVVSEWACAQQHHEDNVVANREFLLRKIQQDRIPLVSLAQEYLSGLGKRSLINDKLQTLAQVLNLPDDTDFDKIITRIDIKKSEMHDEDSMYRVEVNGIIHPICHLSLNDLKNYAMAQYKGLSWNNSYILEQIQTKQIEKLELVARYLGKKADHFSASDELCKLTHTPAKKIHDIQIAQGNDNSMEVTVTFKGKGNITSEIKITLYESDIDRYAIEQYRKEHIAELKRPHQPQFKRAI